MRQVDPYGIVKGRDYKGTDFNDAAATVEDILDLFHDSRPNSDLTDEDIYRRFRMVFGDGPQVVQP